MNTEILLGVGMFTAIIMVLVTVILMARKQLVAAGAVDIEINGDRDKTLSTAAGGSQRPLYLLPPPPPQPYPPAGQCRCASSSTDALSRKALLLTKRPPLPCTSLQKILKAKMVDKAP